MSQGQDRVEGGGRAGTNAASVVTAEKMIKALANVHGSRGVSPKGIDDK